MYSFVRPFFSQNFQSNSGNHSMEVLLIPGIDSCNVFSAVFISCELGQRISNEFSDINDLIDQFHSYRFTIEMKRILPMALIIAQKPVSIGCFGSSLCCRETFKRVCVCKQIFSIHKLIALDFLLGFEKCVFILYGAS